MQSSISIAITFIALLAVNIAAGQDSSTVQKAIYLPGKLFSRVERKSLAIEASITKKQQRILSDLAKQEKRMRRKLVKKNPGAAATIFSNPDSIYQQMVARNIKESNGVNARSTYIPYVDTLSTAMNFFSSQGGKETGKVKSAMTSFTNTAKDIDGAKSLNSLIEERKKYLQDQLSGYGLGKELNKYKKQFYYHKEQIKEYERLFTDPSQVESKALSLLRQSSAYRDFFQRNSQLANMFGVNRANPQSTQLDGLTSRANVQQAIMQQFGTNALPQQMQQQMADAQATLKQLKEKAGQLAGKPGDPEMPNFKPNSQKTKRLVDRLEYGLNAQSTKTRGLLPATSDIGGSLGYKLNDKSVIGIGCSYKIGWGQDIRHIRVSHEGVGLRTFAEYKLKGSFWFSGGMEMNYRDAFNSLESLRQYSAWQQSALAGVSKKYKIGAGKKGTMQLLYDFLHARQTPRTQPVIFRFGYQFK